MPIVRQHPTRADVAGCWTEFGETLLSQEASNQPSHPNGGKKGEVVNQRLKQLMKELGEAINESLSEAEPIAEVIGRIKGEGYDVFLVLEATVGFNRRDEENAKTELIRAGTKVSTVTPPELKISAQDARFLKSLRISVDPSKDVSDRAA